MDSVAGNRWSLLVRGRWILRCPVQRPRDRRAVHDQRYSPCLQHRRRRRRQRDHDGCHELRIRLDQLDHRDATYTGNRILRLRHWEYADLEWYRMGLWLAIQLVVAHVTDRQSEPCPLVGRRRLSVNLYGGRFPADADRLDFRRIRNYRFSRKHNGQFSESLRWYGQWLLP